MKKFKIVFVDDEEAICMMLPMIFRAADVEVVAYSSPFLAIQECIKNPPDLIFTDFSMPGMNGVSLAKKMPPNIPIYLISGNLEIETESCFSGVLQKPCSFEQMEEIINSLKNFQDKNVA